MAILIEIKGNSVGKQYHLHERTRLGRASDNDIQILDINASKYHADVLFRDDHYIIFDHSSKNGIIVNGRQVKSHKILQEKDEITVGTTTFRFVASPESQPKQEEEIPEQHPDTPSLSPTQRVSSFSSKVPTDVNAAAISSQSIKESQTLQMLYEIDNLITVPTAEITQSIKTILNMAINFSNAASGYIIRYDPKTAAAKVIVSIPEDEMPPIPDSLLQKVIFNKQEITTADVINDFRFTATDRELFIGTRSLLCVPIIFGEDVKGILYLAHPLKNQFDIKETKPLKFITHALGVMLENAQKGAEIPKVAITSNEPIFETSKEVKNVLAMIGEAAPSSSIVLLRGEVGVGKGLFAREIHNRSKHKGEPFVEIKCSVYANEEDLEIEVYGCEKGCHPKCEDMYVGKIEQANNGTLFFNEITDIPVSVQEKLLQFFTTKTYNRIGGTELLESDARIIASTSNDLDAISDTQFKKEDFLHLNPVQIAIPPLRERLSDIPLFVKYLIKKYSADLNKKIVGMSDEALRKLAKYNWPINVIELENCIESAIIRAKELIISPDDILLDFGTPEKKGIKEATILKSEDFDGEVEPDLSLDDVEKKHIFATLEKYQWDIVKVASILGIHRNTLRKRIVEYKLTPSKRIRQLMK